MDFQGKIIKLENIKLHSLFFLSILLISFPGLAYATKFSADFDTPSGTIKDISLFNVVRHNYFWGQRLDSINKTYKAQFSEMGTEYIEVWIGSSTSLSNISASESHYDYSKLDAEIDDVVAMGFKPFIRYGEPPIWIEPLSNDTGTHLEQQIKVIKDPVKRQKYLKVMRDVTSHLVSKYGSQTRAWAFSSLNEIGVYNPKLAGGDWDRGSQYLADFYEEFDSMIKSVDPNLKTGGGPEGIGGYEFRYYISYLNSTRQMNKLRNADFIDFHHYGAFSKNAGTDETLDKATDPDIYVKAVKDILLKNGMNTEIWESERNFNADGWDERCSNNIGGIYASLSMVSNAEKGVNKAFNWVDMGSSGFKVWINSPPQESYYAVLLLNKVAQIKGVVTFYKASTDNAKTNFFAVKNPERQLVIISFNRRASSESAASYSMNLPKDFSSQAAYVEVYKYSQFRTEDSTLRIGLLGPLSVRELNSKKTIQFSYGLDPYSMYVFVIYPERPKDPICPVGKIEGCRVCSSQGAVWKDDPSICPSGQVCQSGYCRLPNGGRCSNNSQCISGFCSNTICCNTGQCGWGSENGNPAMCINNGGTKSNQWLSGVCRNGQLKTVLDGWGCGNPKWPCDNGTCICENASGCTWSQYYCRINNSGRDPNQMVSLFNFTCPAFCQPGQDCTCTVSDCSNGIFLIRNLQGQPIDIRMMVRSGDFPITFFYKSPYSRRFRTSGSGIVKALALCLEAGKFQAQTKQVQVVSGEM